LYVLKIGGFFCENNINHVQFELNVTKKNISKTFQPVSTTVGNVLAYPGKGLTGGQQTGDYSSYNEINGLHKVPIKNPV